MHKFRKEKILEELISTEVIYVDDLQTVLTGYRDKITTSNTKVATKSPMIFGNMDEIYNFHSQNLLPELERCGRRADQIAEIFLENSQQLTRIYCRYGKSNPLEKFHLPTVLEKQNCN